MNEWNDNRWREFFDRHTPRPRHDRWFTRRVMNRLPCKRWSIETKISFVVLIAVMAICTVLCVIFAKEMVHNPCWTCMYTWSVYIGFSVACGLCVWQLTSFLRQIYDAS